MKQTKIIMGMPITIEIVRATLTTLLDDSFAFFHDIDERFSPYKKTSEITQVNNGLPRQRWSRDMVKILHLCDETKRQTNGYFDCMHDGRCDPSGIVKGWSIFMVAKRLQEQGVQNFCIEAGGDIQVCGTNNDGKPWRVGIRNPFHTNEIIKMVQLHNKGIATSGTYIRGQHIYDPHQPDVAPHGVQSLTVIAKNIYEADRFATAAFAMGSDGITFIEQQEGLEGYSINDAGIATFTRGFKEYVYVDNN